MATNYKQPGDVIQYTAGADISSGDVVVIGSILGVALVDIANGSTGSVAIRGVFTVPKVDGAAIEQGDTLSYDISVDAFDDNAATADAGDITGAAAFAWNDPADADTTMDVYFTGVPGTIEAGT